MKAYELRVRDVMTRGVIKIGPEATVAEATKLMMDRRVTSLVVEGDGYLGIVTRKDVVNKVVASGEPLGEVRVREIASSPLLMVHPEMKLKDVAALMKATGTRRFVVTDGNRIVGIISNSDIFRAVALELK